MADWFSYAFKSSELDEVHRFPTLSSHTTEKEKEIAKSQQKTEEIFAFPCLRMDLKTKHVQGEGLPTEYDAKPVVECTFVTGIVISRFLKKIIILIYTASCQKILKSPGKKLVKLNKSIFS